MREKSRFGGLLVLSSWDILRLCVKAIGSLALSLGWISADFGAENRREIGRKR